MKTIGMSLAMGAGGAVSFAYFGALPFYSALRIGSFVGGYCIAHDVFQVGCSLYLLAAGNNAEKKIGKELLPVKLITLALDIANAGACYYLISSSILSAPYAVGICTAVALVVAIGDAAVSLPKLESKAEAAHNTQDAFGRLSQ